MKKIFYVIALGAVMMVSCNSGLSPEGQKNWDKFKELSAKFESEEAVDANFESAEEFSAAVKEWNEAAQNMKNYVTEITPEQADSFEALANKCAPVLEKVSKMMQQAAEAGAEEAEEGEEEAEE